MRIASIQIPDCPMEQIISIAKRAKTLVAQTAKKAAHLARQMRMIDLQRRLVVQGDIVTD